MGGIARPHTSRGPLAKARSEVAPIERWCKLSAEERRLWWTMLEPEQRRVLKETFGGRVPE